MINTLSNAYCEISLVVKEQHCTRAFGTRAIRALTTRDISQYTSDNIIVTTTCIYVCMYVHNVCMCLSMYVAIRRPPTHHAIVHVCKQVC